MDLKSIPSKAEAKVGNSLPVRVALRHDNKDNFLQDNGALAYSGACERWAAAASPRMALSAVNILHLNGPLEGKQTQTGLHTNDQRGPGGEQGTRLASVCMCACVCGSVCALDGGWILIVCDVGQGAAWGRWGVWGGGVRGALWPEGNPLLRPTGCTFACLSCSCLHVCVCDFALVAHYPSSA